MFNKSKQYPLRSGHGPLFLTEMKYTLVEGASGGINLLAPELFFFILAHPVYKMWIIQESNTLELWNKLHFEEKKMESIYNV